jgi:hypothetical protein
MPDIFLYSGEPNPNDIKLSDPTSLRSGAAITGTSAQSQSIATSSANGLITVSGSSPVSQSANSSQSTGTITVSGSSALTQSPQTSDASGSISVTGASSQSQSPNQSDASGAIEIPGISGTSECVQSIHISYSEGHVQNGVIENGSPGAWTNIHHRWPDVSGVASSRMSRQRSSASGLISIASKSNSSAKSASSSANGLIVDDVADLLVVLSLME